MKNTFKKLFSFIYIIAVLSLLCSILISTNSVFALGEELPESDGLNLNKTAVWNGSEYEITLEAFTIGTVKTEHSQAMLDKSVVDQSYNMADSFENMIKQYPFKSAANTFLDSNEYTIPSSNKVGETISDNIVTPNINLDSTTVIKDTISPYFKLLDDNLLSNFEIYTVDYLGSNNWDENTKSDLDKTNLTLNDKTISYTGFDFNSNCIIEATNGQQAQGKKIVIKFLVNREDWFIGGNNVPTSINTSGVYNEEQEYSKMFEVPTVDVDIIYEVFANDKAIYAGSNHDDILLQFFDTNEYKIGKDKYLLSKYPKANDYVNISYTYQSNGITISTLDTTKLNETTTYTIIPNITPLYEASTTDNKDAEISTANVSVKLFILKPNINTFDNMIFIGNVFDLSQQVELDNLQPWKCTDKQYNQDIQIIGDQPSLQYEFSHKYSQNGSSFIPIKIDDYEIKVKVLNNGVDITGISIFNHDNYFGLDTPLITKHNHFYIRVIGGEIIINKKLFSNNDVYLTDGDPIFSFKIEKLNGNIVEKTYYKQIRLTDNYTKNHTVTISNLPKGEYRVTELPSLRYKIANGLNSVISNINIDLQVPSIQIYFTNTKKSDDYKSDNDIIVNTFTVNEDKTVTPSNSNLK